jgi:hypothetical protein
LRSSTVAVPLPTVPNPKMPTLICMTRAAYAF